ncbi:hypothetical protein ACFXJ8_21990 [Nonomuraea sp. NPDC059194]|uniref:hypothetical protein n=1 Tax=Nonomuraea sp. NPDC059194 TaxID=3346764 RepID=UPI003699EBB8
MPSKLVGFTRYYSATIARVSSSIEETAPRGRARVWFAAIGAAILLPVAIAWPLGGLEESRKNTPPQIAVGQKVKGNRFQLVPRKAVYTTEDPNPSPFGAPQKGRYVVLDLVVTNVSAMPADVTELMAKDLRVRVDGKAVDMVMDLKERLILRDGDNRGTLLNPGLPENVRLAWTVPEGAAVPKRLTVAIHDEDYKPSWSLLGYYSGTSLWYTDDENPMAILETPLERA